MSGAHVALLRGINVGKAKRVAMADLRALVEGLGYRDVRTLLNSGNVVFTVPKSAKGDPAARIEKAIAARLGVTSRVTVLTGAELGAIVRDDPLGRVADNPSRYMITVLTNPPDRGKLKALAREDWSPEVVSLGRRCVYLWCPAGIIDSRAFAALTKLLGDAITTRNWATINKLHDMTSSPTASSP